MAQMTISLLTRSLLKMALQEDIGKGDCTTDLLISLNALGKAVITAKESGVLCGEGVAVEIFKILDSKIQLKFFCHDGDAFKKGQKILEIRGSVAAILKAERTLLNFLGHLSGIATKTRQFVQRVKGFPVLILDTRKTTPLWRELEKQAVSLGGGKNHRMGLYDAIFVKENHRVHGDLKKLEKHRHEFEIEVRNLQELKAALKLSPRVILFDNFKPAALHRAVQMARAVRPEVILEASGGITLENVAHYAAMGIDWISIGSLTHSVRAIDFSLLVQPR